MNCCICISDITNEDKIITLKCNHTFHYECISKIKNNLCPLCREKITDNKICTGDHKSLFYIPYYYKNGKCRICSRKSLKSYFG